MKDRTITAYTVALAISFGVGCALAAGSATPGATLWYDAADNPFDDTTWVNLGTQVGFDISLNAGVQRVVVADPVFGKLTRAFQFPGDDSTRVGGTAPSLQTLPGNPTDNDATFEVVFRSVADTDRDIVFETGAAGDGVSLIFDEATDTLYFTVKDSATKEQATASGLVSGQFIHAMGVIALDDRLELWVDGELVDVVDATGILDWAGNDPTGLGRRNGNVNEPSSNSLEGDISLVRFYERVLSEFEIMMNYSSLFQFIDISIKPPETKPFVALTPGASLSYDATDNPFDDTTWVNLGTQSGLDFALHPDVKRVAVDDPVFGQLTHAFQFPGGDPSRVGGTAPSLETLPGNPTNNDATFEVVFRSVADSDRDIIFETGGNVDGVSLIFDEATDTLHFTVKDSATEEQATASGLVSGQFVHAVGVIALDDRLELWIDGELVDLVDATGILDWAGSDAAGLGRLSGTTNEPSSNSLEGDISLVRFYERVLGQFEIENNLCYLLRGPSPVNLGARGVTPVAIASTEDFDAASIDPATVVLAGAGVAVRGNGSMAHLEDLDGDGLLDLMLQVESTEFDPDVESGTIVLTGLTFEGRGVIGFGKITIVPHD
jgi:hypothetical protein